MALEIGSESADSGMSLLIYRELERLLSPPLLKAIAEAETGEQRAKSEEALAEARVGWKKISYAIAKGVIDHVISNMEVFGIETKGDIGTSVKGKTETVPGFEHQHDVDLEGKQKDVVFFQSNDGTGLIR
jgi:hypothetical protein